MFTMHTRRIKTKRYITMPGLVDLLKAQVNFQSSDVAKIHFLIDVSQKKPARLAKFQTDLCARVQGKGCQYQNPQDLENWAVQGLSFYALPFP